MCIKLTSGYYSEYDNYPDFWVHFVEIVAHFEYVHCVAWADRYMAPEVFMHKHYDKSVDVFSFAIIVQEVC